MGKVEDKMGTIKTKGQLEQDIKFLKKMVTTTSENFDISEKRQDVHQNHLTRDDIYHFSTENIKAGMEKLDLKDKKVCTVLASGDQALSAHYYGAKEIVCFDINQLTKYYMDLKVAALKVLNYHDYLHFLINHNDNMYFNYHVFSHIKPLLPQDSQVVWEEIYKVVGYQGNAIYDSALFNTKFNLSHAGRIKQMVPYMKNEKSYLETQTKMGDFQYQFESCDIKSLPYILEDKFDFIFLSNILEHNLDEKIKASSEIELLEQAIIENKDEIPEDIIEAMGLNVMPEELKQKITKTSEEMVGTKKQDLKQILFELKDLLVEEMPNLLTKKGEIVLHQLLVFPPREMVEFFQKIGSVLGQQIGDQEEYQDYNQIFSEFLENISTKNIKVDGMLKDRKNKIYFLEKPNYKKK